MKGDRVKLPVKIGGVERTIEFEIFHETEDDAQWGNRARAFPVDQFDFKSVAVAVRYRTGKKMHRSNLCADRKNGIWTVAPFRHTSFGNLSSNPRPICWWDLAAQESKSAA